jgi:hypothetical protein
MTNAHEPTEGLLKDLHEVFEKHNWSGNAIGIGLTSASHGNISAPDSNAATDSSGVCPPGQTPQPYKYQLPDGTWVFGTRCV